MDDKRIRLADIAEELGLSTATVSNVIHGKTDKVSDATISKVQETLEKRGYIPSMAGILLAQNNSRIIGVVVHDHPKYEGHVLTDGFISASVNSLACAIDKAGYFMMVKLTRDCGEIVRFASMWNMDGLVLIGFCAQDYKKLRDSMRIPFVVYDGFSEDTGELCSLKMPDRICNLAIDDREPDRICNLMIDDYDGGFQAGQYLKRMGHEKVLCISDNAVCMDAERFEGCKTAMGERAADFMQIPLQKEKRLAFYGKHESEIMKYTAVFAVSDFYAAELMHYLQGRNIRVPEDISVMGFDDSPYCRYCSPALTTIRQNTDVRAEHAVAALQELKAGVKDHISIKLPVCLVERGSVRAFKK